MIRFDGRAWVLWVAAAAAIGMTGRNPIYSILLILVARLVALVNRPSDQTGGLPLLRLGGLIILIAVIYNALSVHVGSTVLVRLPDRWIWIGGPITLEAVVFGFSAGLVLLLLLAVFAAFGELVPVSELVRMMPRALRDLGVVILIAVTYVPETRRQLQRIREAQAIRGLHMRGFRDWRPILIPLLVGGLERAMAVAESMVARGYGATADTRQTYRAQLVLVAGLALTLAGWFLVFWSDWLGWSMLVSGLLLIGLLLWRQGQRTPYTRYRPRPWTRADSLMTAAVLFALLVVFAPLPFVDRSTLAYSPYPALLPPRIDMWILTGISALALPAALNALREESAT